MHELDRRLQELVLQAQSYQTNTAPRRRRIIQELWATMLPSSTTLPRCKPKHTDDEADNEAQRRLADILAEAQRRLAGIKKWCRDRYSAFLEGDFEQDWSDVIGNVQLEILKKIDIYNKGVDFQLFKEWQKFCQSSQQQQNPEISSEFCQQVEKFCTRFKSRRTKKRNGIIIRQCSPKIVQALAQISEDFCDRIQSQEGDLQQSWNTFCDEVQQLYRPLKFWNWFAFYVKSRFIDLIRERRNVVSTDAPAADRENTESEARIDKIQAKAQLSRDNIQLIREDPDGIFRNKHIRNFPDVNFRSIALLKSENTSLKEIQSHFGDRVDAQTTIGPFYTRTCRYFKPILEEYLEAKIALPKSAIEQIVSDSEGKYNKRRMPDRPQITFKGIIQARSEGVQSWTILARQLQVNVRELIYFYLDCINSFKLIPQTKTRTRRNQNDPQP